MTTLPLPCYECHKKRTNKGGDCIDCNKYFCEKDSIKIEVGEMKGQKLYGVRCNECEAKKNKK